MFALFLIVFIDLVGFGIIIPLLPFYAEHFQASPDLVTLVMATYSLTQFIAAPFWGRLSDRIGRRPVLLMTLAGAIVAYIWLGFVESLTMLFVVRALGGFMAGNISTAFAYMADVTTPENRAKGMGLVGAAFGLGFIAGPAIGGILAGSDPATADYRTPALTAAALSMAAMVLAIVTLKESLSPEIRARVAARPTIKRWDVFRDSMTRPELGLLITISFTTVYVFAGMETTFAMWSERQFHWGPAQNGYLFAGVGILSALIQGGLIGKLSKRFGERRLITAGSVLLAVGLGLIPISTTLPMLALAMAFLAAGFSIMSPSLNALISLQAAAEDQGAIMGMTRSVTILARVIGPVVAGVLFASLGRDWPYITGAVIMAGVVFFSLRVKGRDSA